MRGARLRTREPYPHRDKTAGRFAVFSSVLASPAVGGGLPDLHWPVLIVSGVLEAVWAAALAASDRLRRLGPSVLFAVACVVSMLGLAYAMTAIPTGTAYAVWVGIGACLAAVWGMVTGQERASIARVLLLLGIVACVVGLEVLA